MDFLFSNLFLESILDFGKWSNWKYTNTRIRVFSVGPLPKVQNLFRKQIWNENVHIFIQKIFLKRFGQYLKKIKKWIFLCIFKKWFDQRRVKFLKKKNSERAKHPQIGLSLGGSMPEAQIKQCPLTPSPTMVLLWNWGHWLTTASSLSPGLLVTRHRMKTLWCVCVSLFVVALCMCVCVCCVLCLCVCFLLHYVCVCCVWVSVGWVCSGTVCVFVVFYCLFVVALCVCVLFECICVSLSVLCVEDPMRHLAGHRRVMDRWRWSVQYSAVW